MRNEALFLVEWLAHHMALGFDRIVVFTNDCDDGTDRLIDALARGGAPVERHDNPPPYTAGTIQAQALEQAASLPVVEKADWVLHIDADEYLNVTCGNRRLDDLLALHPHADGIAILWRLFGKGGVAQWEGGSVIETFTRCEAAPPCPDSGAIVNFKTIFRPARFARMSPHSPKLPRGDAPVSIVNAAGTAMPLDKVLEPRGSGYTVAARHCTWANAALHHHHVKSDDLHRAKHDRGDANGRNNSKRLIGGRFYRSVNRNEGEDTSLVAFRSRVRPIETAFRAISGVTELEAAALAQFRARWQQAERAASSAA